MEGSPRSGEWVGGGRGQGRGCTGKHSFLLASGPVSLLWLGSILWGPTPSSLPSPTLAQTRLFSQVPSDVVFHFPALSVLLPPPVTLCFLVSQAVSAPSNLTDQFLDHPPKQSLLQPASPPPSPFPGTNLWSRGLGAQPLLMCLNFW